MQRGMAKKRASPRLFFAEEEAKRSERKHPPVFQSVATFDKSNADGLVSGIVFWFATSFNRFHQHSLLAAPRFFFGKAMQEAKRTEARAETINSRTSRRKF